MLLSKIKIRPGNKVLDVGCGFGIIGLFAATHGAGWVDFIDSNLLATASTTETLTINRVFNASVYTSDLLEKVSLNSYDLILSNPPFHAGHAIDFQITEALIRQAYQSLNPGGELQIVANRFIPYDRLIQEIFGNISYLAESGKYYVLSGSKSD
jgi:16S rRNA (guanine1207-N2)-methyltransferase